MNHPYKITVFTPTYNRAYILEQLYRSLQRQSYRNFEWLVVDDGSCDNTAELFAAWQQEENFFPIRYYKKENGGKCRAINYALDLAQGELFFTVDSDDYLTDDALEKVAAWEAELPKDGRFCGFAANRGTSPTETPCRMFEGGYLDGDAYTRYELMDGNQGERAFVFYTDIHRQYRYPEFPEEKFMTEAIAWNEMANDGYRMRYFNDIIWIWEYKSDGLTKAGYQVFLDNPRGTGLFYLQKARHFRYKPWTYLGMWYGFATENFGRCTDDQIAEYIQMPRWLIPPIRWVDTAVKFIKKR